MNLRIDIKKVTEASIEEANVILKKLIGVSLPSWASSSQSYINGRSHSFCFNDDFMSHSATDYYDQRKHEYRFDLVIVVEDHTPLPPLITLREGCNLQSGYGGCTVYFSPDKSFVQVGCMQATKDQVKRINDYLQL